MAPEILSLADLDFSAEAFDPNNNTFLYTFFYKVENDDSAYYGQIPKRKAFMSPEEFTSGLMRIPDEEIYPSFSPCADIRTVEDPLPSHIHLKRPRLLVYGDYKEQDVVDIIPALLLEEANTLETLSKHPHPGIVKYYGCRVQRGYITGLALERHQQGDLRQYVQDKKAPIDEETFIASLESAVNHLHSVGFAHNDINPANILLDEEKNPVLTDFNSCKPIGEKLSYSRGTMGWMDGEDETGWDTSETRHDLFGVEKIREWLRKYRESSEAKASE